MTRDEHQAQHVVVDFSVHALELRRLAPRLQIARDRIRFTFQRFLATDCVDGTAFGRRHQPGTGIARDAFAGPLRKRRNERILRDFFRSADVAYDARDAGDQFG
jgi:hypothetical protein